jgi:Bacterial Ig-like domain (group 2)
MFVRCRVWGVLFLCCLGSTLIGCSNQGLDSVQVSPTTQSLAVGQTAQFTAVGTYGNANHSSAQNITTSVTWSSSVPAVATISAAGVATGVGAGTTTITASAEAFNGHVSSSAVITVTGSGPTAHALTSITILPGSQLVTNIGETSQYIAIGNYTGTPATQDLTNLVTWGSSDVFVAKIDSSGLATAISFGQTTITAVYTPPATPPSTNPTVSATAQFSNTASGGVVTLPTLTVYKVGVNGSLATVTASYSLPGGTSTVAAINCSPGASALLCTANVPVGVTVTLTTPNRSPAPQPAFGGWSSNCALVAGDPYSCTIATPAPNPQTGTIGNVTVGAIFN